MSIRCPVNGTFELTGRCNLNCKMCYVHVNEERMHSLNLTERTADEWIQMAKQVWNAGTLKLLITGGEPMIRPDFCKIYEEIAKMGFFLTLYTNATLVTPKIMDVLKRYPPHTIGITIYGVSEETYERVCGDGKAYQKMLAGLEQLLTLPSAIELRTTITRDNIMEADQIEAFIKSFGDKVSFNINHTLFQSSRGSIGDAASCRLQPKENVEFYCNRYKKMIEEYENNPKHLTEIRIDREKEEQKDEKIIDTPYGCMAGWQEYTVSWDGRLLPCSLMNHKYAFPFDEGFELAWKYLEMQMVKPVLPGQCKGCIYKEFCGVCLASRYCETGDENGIPEYFCKIAEEYNMLLKQSGGK